MNKYLSIITINTSGLGTSKEIDEDSVDAQNWCSCIDGALTKGNYIDSIRKPYFTNIEVIDEKTYMELEQDQDPEKRWITSATIRAIKQ